jgi:hypothetical protein
MQRTRAAIILWTCAGLGSLSAQDPKPSLPEPAQCPTPMASPTPDSVTLLKLDLACEWVSPKGVTKTLAAFRFLATFNPADGSQPDARTAARDALKKLGKGDPANKDLYSGALGDPGSKDPDFQGLPSFLDMVAEASTRKFENPKHYGYLTRKATNLIEEISNAPGGRRQLAKVQAAFTAGNKHLALYLLLAAYPRVDKTASDPDKVAYARKLELLRAAGAMKIDLAKLVAAKTSGSKS